LVRVADGVVPVSTAPEVVGAYLASLAETHAPVTIRRCLAAPPQLIVTVEDGRMTSGTDMSLS
jgi:hypothetical protein